MKDANLVHQDVLMADACADLPLLDPKDTASLDPATPAEKKKQIRGRGETGYALEIMVFVMLP